MTTENFTLFAIATLLLNITPGNDMLYVATRSINQEIQTGFDRIGYLDCFNCEEMN